MIGTSLLSASLDLPPYLILVHIVMAEEGLRGRNHELNYLHDMLLGEVLVSKEDLGAGLLKDGQPQFALN